MSTSAPKNLERFDSGTLLTKHTSITTLSFVERVIEKYFSEVSDDGLELNENDYFKIVKAAQDELNSSETAFKIVEQVKDDLSRFLDDSKYLVQSNLYLRATRPIQGSEESIGWHRESFYGPNLEECVNIWTPIKNVTKDNTLHFIPGSHLIDDKDIKTERTVSLKTAKGDLRNKIGFLYEPKKILSGINLKNSRPLMVPFGSSGIFKGSLIHGSAINNCKKIRFSVDFRVIADKNYKSAETKKFHVASNRPYFLPFREL